VDPAAIEGGRWLDYSKTVPIQERLITLVCVAERRAIIVRRMTGRPQAIGEGSPNSKISTGRFAEA